MLPMRAVRLALGELLAADTATIAGTPANKIALISVLIAVSENLVYADLTLASFTGSAPKSGVAGAQQSGIHPLTGDQVITILAPAGGWRWECTATPSPAQTIYGFALINDAGTVLLAVQLFDAPLPINEIGDFIDLGSAKMEFVLQPLS